MILQNWKIGSDVPLKMHILHLRMKFIHLHTFEKLIVRQGKMGHLTLQMFFNSHHEQ